MLPGYRKYILSLIREMCDYCNNEFLNYTGTITNLKCIYEVNVFTPISGEYSKINELTESISINVSYKNGISLVSFYVNAIFISGNLIINEHNAVISTYNDFYELLIRIIEKSNEKV